MPKKNLTIDINPKVRRVKLSDSMSEGRVKRSILGLPDGVKVPEMPDHDDDVINDYRVSAAFSEIYTAVSDNRKKVIKEVDRLKKFYLVDAITTQLVEDALAPDTSSGEILHVTSSNKEIQKHVEELAERIDFDQMVKDIAPDLVRYGEYTLRNKFKGDQEDTDNVESEESAGLESVIDDVDQAGVVSLTKNGKTTGYIVYDHEKGKIKRRKANAYTKFQLDGERMRIEMDKFIPRSVLSKSSVKELLEDVPKFIRVGKSYIYPVLSKIKELELLEKLVPATKLNKLSGGSLVGMQLPESYNLDDGLNATKRVEGIINNKITIDDNIEEITVQSIMSSAGRIKVLPVFGEKGQLQKMDYKSDEPDDLLNTTNEIREIILDSIGIPYEIIYKSQGDGKSEILKRYAKYLRRLKNIQRALTNGIRDIIKTDLAASGYEGKFDDSDIDIQFINTLIEIDNVDRLEHMDVTVSMLGNLGRYIDEFILNRHSPLAPYFQEDQYKDYVQTQLNSIGLGSMIGDKKTFDTSQLPEKVIQTIPNYFLDNDNPRLPGKY